MSDDDVSEALFYAVEREFPWLHVRHVSTLAAACVEFEEPVLLILVDASYLPEIDLYAAELSRSHSLALTVLMHDERRHPLEPADVFASMAVRSVLPMSLKLDVWLSVLRVLLRGGEYYPADLFRPYLPSTLAGGAPARGEPRRRSPGPKRPDDESEYLTQREMQILTLVADGLQNKVIAADLHLSEHTVKIHLHNIIRKLGAHNRTQAAAIFHEMRAARFAKPAAFKP